LAEDGVFGLPGGLAEEVEGEVGVGLMRTLAGREILRRLRMTKGGRFSPHVILSDSEGSRSARGHDVGYAVIGDDARSEVGNGHEGCRGLRNAAHHGETGGDMWALGAGLVESEWSSWFRTERHQCDGIGGPGSGGLEEVRRLRKEGDAEEVFVAGGD